MKKTAYSLWVVFRVELQTRSEELVLQVGTSVLRPTNLSASHRVV